MQRDEHTKSKTGVGSPGKSLGQPSSIGIGLDCTYKCFETISDPTRQKLVDSFTYSPLLSLLLLRIYTHILYIYSFIFFITRQEEKEKEKQEEENEAAF